ncbi:MAG: hypothetical protein GXP60_06435 [Epsilonproteobacteria bacterium]|nr:hypothetical protein [Campylobacterota bacterium]
MEAVRPKKRYSQNFLSSEKILDFITDAANLSKNDTVVEVGAGDGRLSARLSAKAKLIAVEIDRSLETILKKRLLGTSAAVIIDDFFNIDLSIFPDNFKVVANLPYASAKHIIKRFIECGRVNMMIVCLQKEVAQKYLNDKKDRSFLGWWLAFYADCQRLMSVERYQFIPVPKVDSEIIAIYPKRKLCYSKIDKERYLRFLKICWKHPKKMVANNLSIKDGFLGDFAAKRAHQIDQNGFLKLYKLWSIYDKKKDKVESI